MLISFSSNKLLHVTFFFQAIARWDQLFLFFIMNYFLEIKKKKNRQYENSRGVCGSDRVEL